jgi:hypothetical protein
MASLAPDREWISFAARSDHLLDPDTPLRNPETIDYPSKEDPSVIPVHVGLLERKKRWTRAYSESFFVLTAAGYLHEYPSSDPQARITPIFSLFLPLCTLGPPSSATTSRSHKFHIEGRKDATGMRTTGLLGRNSQHAYTFRCRSHEEMMEWWNDIRMLVARYLVASEQIERSGPVAAAVRAAGYVSEEDEEGSEEGSSVEEEEEEATAGRYASGGDTDHDEQVPAYSQAHPVKSGLQIGPNGYALEKKLPPPDVAKRSGDEGAGPDIVRRPSRRQQEKAPEGKAPRMPIPETYVPPTIPSDMGAARRMPGGDPPDSGLGHDADEDTPPRQ